MIKRKLKRNFHVSISSSYDFTFSLKMAIFLLTVFIAYSLIFLESCSYKNKNDIWEQKDYRIGSVINIDRMYKMWYVGADTIYKCRIGLAISKDGINWEKFKGNPILEPSIDRDWESNGLFEPTVIFKDNEYKMWYVGADAKIDGRKVKLGYAYSIDGVIWHKGDYTNITSIQNYWAR